MRFRLIGVLAALLMLAPVAGFARTSAPVRLERTVQTSSHKKKEKKMRKKSKRHAKHAKKSKKHMKKKK